MTQYVYEKEKNSKVVNVDVKKECWERHSFEKTGFSQVKGNQSTFNRNCNQQYESRKGGGKKRLKGGGSQQKGEDRGN